MGIQYDFHTINAIDPHELPSDSLFSFLMVEAPLYMEQGQKVLLIPMKRAVNHR